MQDIQKRFEAVLAAAKAVGQEHVLAFWGELSAEQKATLLGQLEELDFSQIAKLAHEQVVTAAPFHLPSHIDPAPFFPAEPTTDDDRQRAAEAWRVGEQALRDGKVCAFTVAGGMGTRLGYDGPKGCYTIGPVTNKPLFQFFAEYILNCRRRYNDGIRWYIMTSPGNHDATVSFFEQHSYFGLGREGVMFFPQGTMPAFSTDGKLLLDQKYSLALSPDGHGGALRAMRKSGALADMKQRGVEVISYFQVDNPLVRCIDPRFVGLHLLANSDMSSKAIPKVNDTEKVGNFAIGDGKLMVIEYSDLPEVLAHAMNADGSRKFDAGSIAIHVISRAFVERITEGELKLPYHRAHKKVPYVDASGQRIEPKQPNAVKLEQFVFDAVPLADNSIVVQTIRAEEFSPVKNAEGVDSAVTCRHDLVARSARWLDAAGVSVGHDAEGRPARVEVSPLRAIFADDLKAR